MKMPPIVSPQEWEVARQELLVEENKLTASAMPWAPSVAGMVVEKEYPFDGPSGPASLLDLFDGRQQC